jgi:DNA-directed RNA polymerase specialized sigma24 family protein
MTHEAYGEAYQQGFRKTVRVLCSRGAPVNFAEDIAQAAWLRGWQKLDQLRDEAMIVSWVNAIAINYHRRGSQIEARYQFLPERCGHIGIDLAPLEAEKILNHCRPRDRVLFEQQMGGLTTLEIAKKQGVTATAIRIRFLRARRAVRASLEDRASELREQSRLRECALAG